MPPSIRHHLIFGFALLAVSFIILTTLIPHYRHAEILAIADSMQGKAHGDLLIAEASLGIKWIMGHAFALTSTIAGGVMFLVAVRRYVRFLKILKLRPVVKIDPKRHIPILTGRQVLVLNGSPHEMVLTLPLSVSDGPYLNKILN